MKKKEFLRLVQVIFLIAGIVLLFGSTNWFPDYYRPRVMAFGSFFFIFLIELPALIWRDDQNSAEKILARLNLQIVLAGGLFFSSLGSLGLWGLYKRGIPYDKFVHFGFPLALAIVGISFFQSQFGMSLKKATLRVLLIIVLSSVAWEILESIFARFFHIGFFGTLFDRDSILDMVSNLAGAGLGVLIKIKNKK